MGGAGHVRRRVRVGLVERLVFKRSPGKRVEPLAVLGKHADCARMTLVGDPPDLRVDELPGALRRRTFPIRKGSVPSGGSTVTSPTLSDIPHRPTMCRASAVAWSRSDSAPVVTAP